MEDHEVQYITIAPDTVLGVLNQFSTSAEGITKFARLVIEEVEEGRVDALDIALLMKTLEKIKEQVNEKLAPAYLKAAEKYSEKIIAFKGAEITIAEHGVKYDFSCCGHPGWEGANKIIEQATEQHKEYEALLKALKSSTTLLIDDEVVTVHPPVKKGKAGINISIK